MAFWDSLLFLLVTLLSVLGSGHVILTKRDPRAAVSWVALIWLVPVFGAALYVLLGINRIRRRATALRRPAVSYRAPVLAVPEDSLGQRLGPGSESLVRVARVVGRVTDHPLVEGNDVRVLVDGEEAYPAMLEAIREASRSISLSTYIFANDRVGHQFRDALAEAVRRGVQVRVIVDSAGERYSWPSMVGSLHRAGVPVARFLPGALVKRVMGLNLRNHRKLLIVDGRVAFTGGMNIRRHHLVEEAGRRATRDLQFRVEGPVVRQLQDVFAEDWAFCTGEELAGSAWFPPLEAVGDVLMRSVPNGPDESLGKMHWTLHAALAAAERSVRIMTPYFLPDRTLITALNLAVMRGVRVDILLPARNNLPFVHWAMMAQLWQVLEHGCRVWLTPPPFDHGKLLVVDDGWTFLGSMNWDPRSLRLNFELNCECYDPRLAHVLDGLMRARQAGARELALGDVDGRPLAVRLRDGVARLFMPFL